MQIDDLADTIQSILDGYREEFVNGVNEAGKAAAEECKNILRQNSPKRFGRYARSWAVKETPGRPGEPMRYTVYNKKYYRLTHLLEKGHAKRGGGRVPAQVHIAPAEEVAVQQLQEMWRWQLVEIKALKALLEQLGLSVAITSFFDEMPLPFIILLPDGAESSGSDFAAELRRAKYQVELYTVEKDIDLEERLEALFDERGIHFEKYEAYIDEEAMYQCAYQIEFYYVK